MLEALFQNETYANALTDGKLIGAVDVELTNRCNARCSFCPRDVAPHQGTMTDEIFEQTLQRVVEFRSDMRDVLPAPMALSFCGLGEQLLNPRLPEFVARGRAHRFSVAVNTNAALLDERRSRALLDAGLSHLAINAGALGEEYETVYRLPFARLRDNVVRFLEMAGDDCDTIMVLVDIHGDSDRVNRVRDYWRSLGVRGFFRLPLQNRGGSLELEGMDFLQSPYLPAAKARVEELGIEFACGAPIHFPFVGYDGQYYLCSNDWKKEMSVGDVFKDRLLDTFGARLDHVRNRDAVCKTCVNDAVNVLALLMARREAGEVDDAAIARMEERLVLFSECIGRAVATLGITPRFDAPAMRRLPLVS